MTKIQPKRHYRQFNYHLLLLRFHTCFTTVHDYSSKIQSFSPKVLYVYFFNWLNLLKIWCKRQFFKTILSVTFVSIELFHMGILLFQRFMKYLWHNFYRAFKSQFKTVKFRIFMSVPFEKHPWLVKYWQKVAVQGNEHALFLNISETNANAWITFEINYFWIVMNVYLKIDDC